jgi:hypothetical protein
VVLVPASLKHLWHTRHRNISLVILGLVAVDLLVIGGWGMWWGGWNWGPRLIAPAIPLLAVLSVAGASVLARQHRGLVLGTVIAAGLMFSLPGVVVDLLGGYGGLADGSSASFRLQAFPPFSAWTFLHHCFAESLTDSSAVDILWFRLYRSTRGLSLVPFVVCLLGAASLTRWHSRLCHKTA